MAHCKSESRDRSPVQEHGRPDAQPADPASIGIVAGALKRAYGTPLLFNRSNPFEELLFVICSIQTNEALYRKTFARLRRRFRTFEQLRTARLAEVAAVLKGGGMAMRKARQMKSISNRLYRVFGRVTLRPLMKLSDSQCEAFLTALDGVGKKDSALRDDDVAGPKGFPGRHARVAYSNAVRMGTCNSWQPHVLTSRHGPAAVADSTASPKRPTLQPDCAWSYSMCRP